MVCLLALKASGQTVVYSTPPPTPQIIVTNDIGFVNATVSYFSTLNTNFAWSKVGWEVGTGYKSAPGIGSANTMDIQKDWSWLNFGLSAQLSGNGALLNQVEGQVGVTIFRRYDVKLDFDLRGGWDFNEEAVVFEPALFLRKRPTATTFLGVGLGLPQWLGQKGGVFQNRPAFYAITGFTF